MKVSVLQENLAYGLGIVSRAVSSRSTLPVLSNILLATDEGRLRLSATNLELGITCWIGAKIEEEWSTTVPSRTFNDMVSTLSGQTVDLSLIVRTQTLNVLSGTSNTNIKCIDAQEFPPMLAADISDGIQINVADLREMIQQVALAASSDEARPVLTGVMVKVEGNTVTMSAADGFRLSRRRLELSSPVSQDFAAIIPARALSELARVAGDADQVVTMSLPKDRNQVVFHLKDIELISQLIEGTYPNVEQVIPKSHTTRTIVSTAAFLKACKQAEIFAREGTHIVRINIIPGGDLQPGKVEISGQSEETGFNQTDVEASIEGSALLIAFNVRFLREVLEIIKTPNVVLETTADNSPGLIKPAGEQDFLHVIMPMHLGS
jgi:DNA polymerase-3 subunit beta